MAVNRVEGEAPFVIDRQLPKALFERAPGHRSFVADGTEPMKFASQDEAVEFLRENAGESFGAFDWNIVPWSEYAAWVIEPLAT